MTFERKLRSTLIQTFSLPPGRARSDEEPGDRMTAVGGSAPSGDDLPVEGDVVGGCYRLVRRLGEGMFGRVYLAERTDVPEHRVALKVVNREVYGGRDVERELVMLAATVHPNIVQLKDHGMTEDFVWLTMPLYEGETLAERLERGPLTLREAHDVFVPIAQGVHALHERGLRHQDIKPENIFLADIGPTLHPVLLDLGVAVEASSPFVAGTALYGSPEQVVALGGLEGEAQLSEKMDTYCLAATLLRSITGPDAFPGERASSPFDIANAFEEREVNPLVDDALPDLAGPPRAALRGALSKWLTRDPDCRPNAGQLANELGVLLAQERAAAKAIEREIAQQRVALKRVRVALGAAAVVGAAVALWGVSHRETLRLARELEHARAVGADRFDKLDTCAAAHQLAETRATTCGDDRAADKVRFETAIAKERTSHTTVKDKLEGDLRTGARRLRICADEKHQAAETCTEEQEALKLDVGERDKTIGTIRGEMTSLRSELTTLRSDLATSRKQGDESAASLRVCTTERAAFEESRNSCEASLASCEAKASAPPAAPSSAPAAPPSDKNVASATEGAPKVAVSQRSTPASPPRAPSVSAGSSPPAEPPPAKATPTQKP